MKIIKELSLLGAGMLLAAPLAAQADDDSKRFVRESIQVSDHYMFMPAGVDPAIAPGATILVRDYIAGIATATVMSTALAPKAAYSIWWVVFNKPQFCGVPQQCGLPDLKNAATVPSVFWGGGLLADNDGYGMTQLELRMGRTERELFGGTEGHGLQDLKRAEIHLVLRSHGETGLAGTVATQIGTANAACPPSGCSNVFFSVHNAQ